MSEKSLAERIHEANIATSNVESELWDRLFELFADGATEKEPWYTPFEDTTTDDYDNSFEALQADPSKPPTDEQLKAILSWGFLKGWWCFKDGTEITFGMWDGTFYRGALKPSVRAACATHNGEPQAREGEKMSDEVWERMSKEDLRQVGRDIELQQLRAALDEAVKALRMNRDALFKYMRSYESRAEHDEVAAAINAADAVISRHPLGPTTTGESD